MSNTNAIPFLFLKAGKNKLSVKNYFKVVWYALTGRFNTDTNMTVVDKHYLKKMHDEYNDLLSQRWDLEEAKQALRLKLRSERVLLTKMLSCLDDVVLAWEQDDAYPSSEGLIHCMSQLKAIMPQYYAIYRPEYEQFLQWEYKLLDKQEIYDKLHALRNDKGETL